MTRVSQDAVGRCDFVDVLEEAVLRRHSVAVELRDGQTFLDTVVDVVTEGGRDYAVFHRHPRVPVEQVRALVRHASGGQAASAR